MIGGFAFLVCWLMTHLVCAQLPGLYKEIPTLCSSDLPALTANTPVWALPLYQYPLSPMKVEELLKNQDFTNLKPLSRFCKNFLRNASPFIDNEGYLNQEALSFYNTASRNNQTTSLFLHPESAPSWEFIGPKETFWLNTSGSSTAPKPCPWQVNVYSLDVAKTNSSVLFAGTETGFVNKTSDRGIHWEMVGGSYFFGGGVTAVAIHPNDENMVFVAAGRQIHQSTDGGLSWKPLLHPNDLFQARRLEMVSSMPNRLLAATDKGVYISNDLGVSWLQATTEQCWDAHTLPKNKNHIVALTESNGSFSLIYSLNGGVSFQSSRSFPKDITQSSGGLISVTPDDPELIHVVMLSDGNLPMLYEGRGPNGSWNMLAQGNTAQLDMDNGQGYYDLVLETSPVNRDLIYVGTTSLFLSRNKGQSFERIGGYGGDFPIHPDLQDLKIVNATDTWVATDGGLTLTTDQFNTQENAVALNNGIIGSAMWGFDQGWNEDIVVGGRYHNGNTAISDFYQPKALRMGGAESPTGWVLKGKSRHVAFNDLGNGWILPKNAESQPEGRFIYSKYPNMDEYGGRRGNVVAHPNYYGHLTLGQGSGIWQSKDQGETYELIHDFGQRVRFIDQSFSNPDVLYADVINRGLHRSDDGGITWSSLPSLTDSSSGTAYWQGKTHFVISPNNSDRIYACLSNGTWTNDRGKIFKSIDGGVSWSDISFQLSAFTKSLAIQVDKDGDDILYLAGNSHQSIDASIYYLLPNETEWKILGEGFPSGFNFNHIIPFYRDGLLRAGGNGGVWSHDLIERSGLVLPQPWVQKKEFNCFLDTLFFNDHSIVKHENTSWSWNITPSPDYINSAEIRNPQVVLGAPGDYTVSLTITREGKEYTKTIDDMIYATTCPSVDDCDNPDYLDKSNWALLYFDSEEVNFPGRAAMAMDDDPSTIWHTRWSSGTDPYPHELQWDLGRVYDLKEFKYLPRQVGVNGRVNEYEIYVSDNLAEWGSPIIEGSFINSSAPQSVNFPPNTLGRYARFVCLSEVGDGPWASVAEIDLLGCVPQTTSIDNKKDVKLNGFPVPSSGIFTIPIGQEEINTIYLIHPGGQASVIQFSKNNDSVSFDLSSFPTGQYIIKLKSRNQTYIVNAVKM